MHIYLLPGIAFACWAVPAVTEKESSAIYARERLTPDAIINLSGSLGSGNPIVAGYGSPIASISTKQSGAGDPTPVTRSVKATVRAIGSLADDEPIYSSSDQDAPSRPHLTDAATFAPPRLINPMPASLDRLLANRAGETLASAFDGTTPGETLLLDLASGKQTPLLNARPPGVALRNLVASADKRFAFRNRGTAHGSLHIRANTAPVEDAAFSDRKPGLRKESNRIGVRRTISGLRVRHAESMFIDPAPGKPSEDSPLGDFAIGK